MSFEAEVIPLFIGCSTFVLVLELLAGLALLKGRGGARFTFAAHVCSMALALFFLVRCIFPRWLGLGIEPYDSASNSVNIGLFGVFWAFSVVELVFTIADCIHDDKTTA